MTSGTEGSPPMSCGAGSSCRCSPKHPYAHPEQLIQDVLGHQERRCRGGGTDSAVGPVKVTKNAGAFSCC